MKKVFIATIISFFLAAPLIVFSAGDQGLGGAMSTLQRAGQKTGLGTRDVYGTMSLVGQGLFAVVGTVFLILTIYAGILWMSAAGNEERVGKAKDILITSVIGLFVSLAGYAITTYLINLFQ